MVGAFAVEVIDLETLSIFHRISFQHWLVVRQIDLKPYVDYAHYERFWQEVMEPNLTEAVP